MDGSTVGLESLGNQDPGSGEHRPAGVQELVLAVLLDIAILAEAKWVVTVVAGQLTVQVVRDLCAVKQTAGQEENSARACRTQPLKLTLDQNDRRSTYGSDPLRTRIWF